VIVAQAPAKKKAHLSVGLHFVFEQHHLWGDATA